MTNAELDIIQHATGRNYNPRHDRNSYCAEVGSSDWHICHSLVKRGFMLAGRTINGGADQYFSVTAGGESAYVKQRPPARLTRGQKRYQEFLLQDSGIPFGEWLRQRSLHVKEEGGGW